MALELGDRPPDAPNQFEMILDRIEAFVNKIDKAKLIKFAKVLLKLTKIAFKFVPMTSDEKQLFNDITSAADGALGSL